MSTLSVDTIKKADGTGNLSVPAETGTVVTTASPSLGRRNLIINGAMQVAQRGTSQTAAGYGSIDRWQLSLSGATATLSQESFTLGQTDVVGAEYYAKVDVTTGNNNCGLYYKVEAKDVLHTQGQEVTLSYWAKGTSPTNGLKVGLALVATGAPSFPSDESVTLTSTWTKYTHTFTLPSFTGTTLDASSYLQMQFDQDAGDTGTAAWELNVALVQLEVGDTATPYEHRSFGEELALCQRYYYTIYPQISNSGIVSGQNFNSSAPMMTYILPTEMRANPSFSVSSPSDFRLVSSGAVLTPTGITLSGSAKSNGRMDVAGTSVTAGNGSFLQTSGTSARLSWDAEL